MEKSGTMHAEIEMEARPLQGGIDLDDAADIEANVFDALAQIDAGEARLSLVASIAPPPLAVRFSELQQRAEILADDLRRLHEALAPAVFAELCGTCDGIGWLCEQEVGAGHLPITMIDRPHRVGSPAGIVPCEHCVRCKDCGRGGCGPGVRIVRARREEVAES